MGSQLETWCHAGAATCNDLSCKPEVQLLVPAGQQDLAVLLVKGA
jgi:hypothetical protein